ncbi:MAG: CMGC/CDK protein kinase [Amphiamblys sp. WSBS2006]|nr:MAG: CMGC/CDK protein kinase [Amphiamblys sp. WSBS2006]
MAGKYLKHPVLFFLSASAAIVSIEAESVVDTDKPSEYYDGANYEKLGLIASGSFGTVSKIEEKKTMEVYVLKTFLAGSRAVYAHAENEINALKQLDHENIVKMVACSDIRNKQERDGPVHIVLEHMPCDLHRAIQNHPEIKENTREILRQVLKGIAHIHGKKLAHGDLKPENILIDFKTMTVKICDFGCCCGVEEEKNISGETMDGYRQDILSIVYLMVRLYLGESFSDWISLSMFIRIDELERFVKAKESGVILDNRLGTLYKKMEGVVSENGLGLFLKLIASENAGAYTTAAEALEHPFFDGVRELDQSKQKREEGCPGQFLI